jgi:hypothetical protein
MGLYFNTFLCNGSFISEKKCKIIEKIQIANIDPIIENVEWESGKVDLSEIQRFVNRHKPEIEIYESIINDLFLEEVRISSYEGLKSDGSKFILVSKNYEFK